MRPRLHDCSSQKGPVLKGLLGRDGNHSSLHDTNLLLWPESYFSTIPGSRERHSLDSLRCARLFLEELYGNASSVA